MRPRLLDLFCCAGGAGMGYHLAGFDVVGVDVEPQPRYPFEFVQADALEYFCAHWQEYDAVHASPPCQANLLGLAALNRSLGRDYDHVDLLDETREYLVWSEKPYVIEQPMKGARLRAPAVYCGSSFGLPIHRHRQFESNVLLMSPACEHDRLTEKKYWTSYRRRSDGTRDTSRKSAVVQVYGNGGDQHEWGPALGMPAELTQAIPPAYTQHIGEQLIRHLNRAAA